MTPSPPIILEKDADAAGGASELHLENQLCLALYRTSHSLTRAYADVMKPLGLTYPQLICMMALWQKSPRTVTEISLALDLGKATITPLLMRIEAQGLVSRERDGSDERRVNISLTPRGLALREPVLMARRELVCSVAVMAHELDGMKRQLNKLHAVLADAA